MTQPQRITFDDIFKPWEECTCGRKFGELHCPHCGSGTVRAVPSRFGEATLPNGQILANKVWACRKCGEYFDNVKRTQCTAEALKPKVSRQAKKEAKQAITLSEVPESLQKWMADYRRKNGIVIPGVDDTKGE